IGDGNVDQARHADLEYVGEQLPARRHPAEVQPDDRAGAQVPDHDGAAALLCLQSRTALCRLHGRSISWRPWGRRLRPRMERVICCGAWVRLWGTTRTRANTALALRGLGKRAAASGARWLIVKLGQYCQCR